MIKSQTKKPVSETPKKRGRPRKVLAELKPKTIPAVEARVEKIVEQTPIVAEAEVKAVKKTSLGKYFYAIGRRKSATAKVRAYEDESKMQVNKNAFGDYFSTKDLQRIVLSPLALLGLEKKLGFEMFVSGGGKHAQAEAVKLAIARTLIIRNIEDKPTLRKAGFLTRDSRVKERKKPGLKRARRGPQWAKR